MVNLRSPDPTEHDARGPDIVQRHDDYRLEPTSSTKKPTTLLETRLITGLQAKRKQINC